MSDCRFGVSPVNYPDPDPEVNTSPVCEFQGRITCRYNSENVSILILLLCAADSGLLD